MNAAPAAIPVIPAIPAIGAGGLTDIQKCEQVANYANSDVRELWESLDSYSVKNWDAYRAEIIALYGINESLEYSRKGLTRLCRKAAADRFEDSDEFGAFDRSFQKMANWLKKKG